MAINRPYWSERQGRGPSAGPYALPLALSLFSAVVENLDRRGYFQEWFGYDCVDAGFVPGKAGEMIDEHVFLALHRHGIWPPSRHSQTEVFDPDGIYVVRTEYWDEDTFLDVVEFLHDRVSRPLAGREHTHSRCGWHYNVFDTALGQSDYRQAVNEVLKHYGPGFELSAAGEVRRTPPDGMQPLLETEPTTGDPRIQSRVESAVTKYRNRHSTQSDRRDAVRDLADVLELIRADVGQLLGTQSEDRLFEIANNFGIRHLNDKQRLDYDSDVWLQWMFYLYLTNIHLVLALRECTAPK